MYRGLIMRLVSTVLLILGLLSPSLSHASEPTLTVSTSPSPPLFFPEPFNEGMQGLEYDLVSALAKQAGFKVEFKRYPWNRVMAFLEKGKLDLTMSMTRTPEREKFIHFLGFANYEQFCILVSRKSDIKIEKLDDLTKPGFKFGLHQNYHYSNEFNQRLENDPEFRSHFEFLPDPIEEFDPLVSGKIQGFIFDGNIGAYALKTDKRMVELRMVCPPFFPPSPVNFAVSKQIPPEKIDQLQKAYDSLKADGTLNAILERYIKIGYIPDPTKNEQDY